MKSLRYTNFLLTVIAVCLVYQCVKFEAPPSMAQGTYTQGTTTASANRPIPVQIIGTPIVKVDGRVYTETAITGMPSVDIASVSAADPGKTKYGLPVMVLNPNNQVRPNQPVDVNIVGAGPIGQGLNVNITGYDIRNPLPVQVTNRRDLSTATSDGTMPVRIINADDICGHFPDKIHVDVDNWPAKP